jgi:hypothetical protein
VQPNKLETLDDLLAQAEHYAGFCMRNSGKMSPTLFLIGADGPLMFVPASLVDANEKDDFATTARLVCIAHAATVCVMALEAWMKTATPGEKMDMTEPPSEAFDRQEVIVLMGESHAGQKQKFLPIIRSGNGKFFNLGETPVPGMDKMEGRFIHHCKALATVPGEIVFKYTSTGKTISILEPLVGKSGWLCLTSLTISSFDTEDWLLFAGITDVRAGVTAVDRLNIVAHDKFQEIVDEANKPDSAVRLTQVILDPAKDLQPTKTVIAQPTIIAKLTATPAPATPGEKPSKAAEPLFQTEQERKIAEITVKVIQQHETLPQVNYLQKADVQAAIIKEVAATYVAPAQTELTGIVIKPDIAAIVAKATKLVIDQTIDIPRIVVVPTGDVTSGFNTFTLDCSSIHLQPVSRELLIQHLRTAKQEFLQNVSGQLVEARPENYIVRALIDFDDISYDDHADLLYDLAGQLVKHLHSYLSPEDTINVLQYHQQQLAALIHSQMQLPEHRWEKATGYKATVSKGFSALKENAYTANATDDIKPFRMTVSDPTNIKRYVFGGFSKCLYEIQKFDVDTERRFAVILEDDGDVLKWFKPARNQFQIYYNKDAAYEPDFVVETKKQLFLCEPKRADQMQNPEVVAKKTAASEWCKHATEHAQQHGGKKWSYLLIPHDAITGNMTLAGLASRFAIS